MSAFINKCIAVSKEAGSITHAPYTLLSYPQLWNTQNVVEEEMDHKNDLSKYRERAFYGGKKKNPQNICNLFLILSN